MNILITKQLVQLIERDIFNLNQDVVDGISTLKSGSAVYRRAYSRFNLLDLYQEFRDVYDPNDSFLQYLRDQAQ